MIKNPYIGMPIEIISRERQPHTSCSAPSMKHCNCHSCNTEQNGNNDNIWQDNGTFDSINLGNLPIAMCYVPYQRWKTTYSPDQALTAGTLFPELNLPFKGGMRR